MPKFSISLDVFSNSNENERFPTLSEEELANLGSENQNQNTSKSTNSVAERKCSVTKRESWKIFLAMSYVCRCNSLSFFAKIRKEDGDEYEPDSWKENAGIKKLKSSFGHFVDDFNRSMQYFHPVASFANSGE